MFGCCNVELKMVLWIVYVPLIIGVVLVGVRLMYKYTSGSYTINRSLKGRVFLVTGASSGIGFETAQELYRHDATVVMLCRDVKKAGQCLAQITSTPTDGRVDIVECNLSSLDSVRKCAAKLLAEYPRIHVLINNAGQGGEPGSTRHLTQDGLELTMVANFFGHLLLTYLLLDRLKASGGARIVNVSSLMHAMCRRLSMDSLNFDHEPYNSLEAYCRSKLAQIMWTRHLAKELSGQDVRVFALNPGVLATPISRYFVKGALGDSLASFIMPIALVANTLIAKTAFEGAQTTLYLAVAPEVERQSGAYFADCAVQTPFALARDEQLAEALTNKSRELVGISPGKQTASGLLETDL